MQLNGSYIWMVLDYIGFCMQKPLHKESGFYIYHCERINAFKETKSNKDDTAGDNRKILNWIIQE